MDASVLNADNDLPRLKVSITARLIAALAYTIPAIGGAMGSILLMNLFRLLRSSENAGVSTVMKGMKEASLPLLVSLYLAAVCGIAVIVVLIVRMIIQTKTASPPFWFFAIGGVLCLLPAALFWKAQLLIIEALSPGSSIGPAGISAVAADINRLLIMSLIAAPVVFIVLVVLAVWPLSSRPGPKVGSLIVATGTALLLIATAIAVPFLIGGPKRENEIVNLPANVKYADSDYDLVKESSTVLTLTSADKLYQRQSRDAADKVERMEAIITKEELPAKLKSSFEGKTPDKRIVYFKCDVNTPFGSVLEVFDGIRKADVDRVGLVVVGEKNVEDPYQISPLRFQVRLQGPINKDRLLRPNPLMLVAMLDKDGKLRLNNDEMGTVLAPENLENKLRQVFRERENNGLFREGTNEIEETVFLKVSRSTRYGDFIKLVEAVKDSGAQPIGIQIDDVN